MFVVGCHSPRDPQRIPMRDAPLVTPSISNEMNASAAPKIELAPAIVNQDILICGRRVAIGTPVVLWTEAPFYDAYKTGPRFAKPDPAAPPKLRYQPGRVRKLPNPDFVERPKENSVDETHAAATAVLKENSLASTTDTRSAVERSPTLDQVVVPPESTDTMLLRDVVDQFVLHFDVCGISRTCFRVLQDERNLSVHFMLDVDGTLYQTLDLRDTAWHATKSNPRSIGIEIAQIGAYSARDAWRLDPWYEEDEQGTRLTFPSRIVNTGIRTQNFQGRTARPRRLIGRIQAEILQQFDFTPEQYAALAKLTAALCREFPKLRPEAPRDEKGFVLDRVMDQDSWLAFAGILGHYHVQKEKVDPGPAFDWEPFLDAVRNQLALSELR